MTDDFDRFLREALAPERRDPDRRFVARVQARIALDRYLKAERRGLLRRLGAELLALLAVAAGLLWLGRAAPVAGFFAESPGVALAALLSGFALLVLLVSRPANEPTVQRVEWRPTSNL
ncbi:MAG TPA: hypothetical protein VFU87_07435 [Sphingomicrobium sp.]|nr:hypothetical protein [Sphingomicrobium sp.]